MRKRIRRFLQMNFPERIQDLPDGNYWAPDLIQKYGSKTIRNWILTGMLYQRYDLVLTKE